MALDCPSKSETLPFSLFDTLDCRHAWPILWLQGIGYLSNIVRDTDKEKLPLNLFQSSEPEFAKPHDLFDMAEDRFDNRLAPTIDSLAVTRVQLAAHHIEFFVIGIDCDTSPLKAFRALPS